MDIEKLKADLRKFVKERDWDQFHSAKNLVMALSGEAGAVNEKMKLNDKKYPVELSKGNATKYNRRKKYN